MRYRILIVLLCVLIYTGCGKQSYNSADFSNYATGDIYDARLSSLVMSFLRDLSENRIPQEEQNGVFKVLTNIFIGKEIDYYKDKSYIDVFRFAGINANLVDGQIVHNLQKQTKPFPLFNRYRCKIKAKVYLNDKFTNDLTSDSNLFSGFTNTIPILQKELIKAKNVVKIKGTIIVFDFQNNNKEIYSRQIDILQEIKNVKSQN